jgi:hypothetical protein
LGNIKAKIKPLPKSFQGQSDVPDPSSAFFDFKIIETDGDRGIRILFRDHPRVDINGVASRGRRFKASFAGSGVWSFPLGFLAKKEILLICWTELFMVEALKIRWIPKDYGGGSECFLACDCLRDGQSQCLFV